MSDAQPDQPSLTPLMSLKVFANMVERHDFEVGATMLVSGAWVSGMLTSTRRYLDALTDSITSGAKGKTAREFAGGLAEAMEGPIAHLLAVPEEEREHGPEVYLRKARVWIGDQAVDDLVLAVRTDQVDAFFIGNRFTMPPDG